MSAPSKSPARPRGGARADGQMRLAAADPLLRGTSNETERRARRRLLRELMAAGVARNDLQRAVDEDRLALIPAEIVLAGRRRYGDEALEKHSGLDRDQLAAFVRASGTQAPEELTAWDLAAARRLRQLLDAGIPLDSVLEVARVAGQGLASTARAILRIVGETYLRPGDTEYELGARYAQVADELLPVLGPLVDYQLRLHLREALRQEAIGREERARGQIQASRDVAVAFADLVGFTRMGTRVEADEIGRVAVRLAELVSEVVSPPVTVVKYVGDAVMLVSPDAGRLVEDLLAVVDAVDAEGEHFPQLRAGVAYGPAVPVSGDWYGHVVNLASRITAVARPGTVVGSAEIRAVTKDRLSWSRPLPRHLKGVPGVVLIARVRAPAIRDGQHRSRHRPSRVRARVRHLAKR
jgi:adenylate cyclase